MSYTDASRDTYGMYRNTGTGSGSHLMGAHTLLGEDVYNGKDENLGGIKACMLDMDAGNVTCAVLSFGAFLAWAKILFPSL